MLPINSFLPVQNTPNAKLIMYSDTSHGAQPQYAEDFLRQAQQFLGRRAASIGHHGPGVACFSDTRSGALHRYAERVAVIPRSSSYRSIWHQILFPTAPGRRSFAVTRRFREMGNHGLYANSIHIVNKVC